MSWGVFAVGSGVGHVVSLGNSMGGTGAIIHGEQLGAGMMIGFCPQSTVSPRLAPFENRYEKHVKEFPADHRYSDLAEVNPSENVYIFYGVDSIVDGMHAKRLTRAGYDPVFVLGCGHNVAAYLKQLGVLKKLLGFAIRNDKSSLDALVLNDIPHLKGAEAAAYIALCERYSCCKGNKKKLVGVLEDMLAIVGDNPRFLYELSRRYSQTNQSGEAMKKVRKAISVQDDNPNFYLHLSWLLREKGDDKGAERAKKKADKCMS